MSTLEEQFRERYGLNCQVILHKKGSKTKSYTSCDMDSLGLTELNRRLEASGEFQNL